MARSLRLLAAALLLCESARLARSADDLPPAARSAVDFDRDIRPILAGRCVSCHGPEQHKGGLRLDQKDKVLQGGDTGACIEPGNSAESLLIEKVAGLDPAGIMPPKGDPLTSEQVGLLRAWIDQGAPWPDGTTLAAEPTAPAHWAFQPPVRPPIPATADRAWPRNPIDAFILAKLEREGVRPAAEADRRTLIRRLSLDLLGLLPTPDEVEAFVQDFRGDSYERLVDRLLASPHFGERWGRHWLDLARYADSDGYEKDNPRPFAYRYRDWVINAVNRDLPFDQFTIEQLAGDLLPGATLEQRIATGFHRNTLTNTEGGVDKEEFRVAAVVDRTSTTGTVWLGLTVGCAQCHSHKYDPLTQREFYGLFAFFNSGEEVDLPVPPRPEDQRAYAKAKAEYDEQAAKLKRALDAYEQQQRPGLQAAWEAAQQRGLQAADDAAFPNLAPDVLEALATPAESRTKAQADRLAELHRAFDPEYQRLKARVEAHARRAPKAVEAKAPTLTETAGGRKTHLLVRGDFLRPADEVAPGTPAFLPALRTAGPVPSRLDLARWLVDPAHPLTARVEVNRTWRNLFGRPLVASLDDFGTRGAAPTHPELLDWLATEYPRLGWSRKALIKLIVTSAAYRQSSHARPELLERDPNNDWLARQNRFRPEAEIVRDLFLVAGGLLVPRIGGPSVRPPQPAGISELTYAGSAKWVESTGPDRYRRGLYTWFQRTSPFPMLTTFDAPDMNTCAVKRERSNTPLQALTLLNEAAFIEAAQGLARRVLEGEAATTEERIGAACVLCLGRRPDPEETKVLLGLYHSLLSACPTGPEAARLAGRALVPGVTPPEAAAWTALARTILNLDEFVTRE